MANTQGCLRSPNYSCRLLLVRAVRLAEAAIRVAHALKPRPGGRPWHWKRPQTHHTGRRARYKLPRSRLPALTIPRLDEFQARPIRRFVPAHQQTQTLIVLECNHAEERTARRGYYVV